MNILIGLITRLVFAACIYSIATSKARSGGLGFLGFFFPIIAGIIALFLKDKSDEFSEANCGYTGRCPYYQNRQPPEFSSTEAPQAVAALPPGLVNENGKKWVVCANCGERAALDYARIRKHCPRCDTAYDLNQAYEEILSPSPGVAQDDPVQAEAPAAAPGPKHWACDSCGGLNPPIARYCMLCGSKREE